jgi:Flp pilus assembly protein TadG
VSGSTGLDAVVLSAGNDQTCTSSAVRKRFLPDEEGVSAVEFALIMPLFISVAFAAVEFALIFFTYNAAGHAAWDVARQLATNRIVTSQASAIALAELPRWVRSSATATPASSSTDPSTNRFTVTISFPARAASPTNVMSWAYGSLTLTATSSLQQEPTS